MSEVDRKHTLMREDIGTFNPLEFGPSGWQSTLEITLAEIGDTPSVMMITPGIWTIDTSLQIPANVKLHIAQDAIIRVESDQILTLSGGYIVDGLRAFDADGVITGHIEFDRIVLVGIVPEHWGVDPTGTIANNILWAEVFRAATTNVVHPVLINGIYLLDDETSPALSLVNHLQLRGNMRHANPSINIPVLHATIFYYEGAGDAIGMVDTGVSYANLVIENVYIEDRFETGDHGMMLIRPQSLTMRNVFISGFSHGITVSGGWYYGRTEQLKVRDYRTTGLIVTDNMNGNDLDVHLNTRKTTVTYNFMVGFSELGGAGGQINDSRVFALVEHASGMAARVGRARGGEYNIYVESRSEGIPANYHPYGIAIDHCTGVNFQIFGNMKSMHNIGLYISSSEGPYPANSRITLSGRLFGAITYDVQIENGPLYAINTTGFDFDTGIATGIATTGFMLGDRYFTSAHRIPAVDEGRGSTLHSRNWKVNDIVESLTAIAPGKYSRFVCTEEGNPGRWAPLSPRHGFIPVTTATYGLTPTSNGEHAFSNTGAATIVTFNLPSSQSAGFPVSHRFKFLRTAAFAVRVLPSANGIDIIRGAPSINRYIQLDSDGTCIELEYNAPYWELVSQRGTISYQAP